MGIFLSESKTQFESRDDFGNFNSNLLFIEKTEQLRKEYKILEIGTGTCRLLSYLHGKGYSIEGVDINSEYLEQGEKLYGKLPVTRIDSERLPFADNSFDLVLGFDVFEHIRDTEGHLNEVSRVLTKNGCYLLQTPNKWTNTLFETIRWKSFTAWREEHCSLHSYSEVKNRFSRHGYDVTFFDIPIVTEYFRKKVHSYLGGFGLFLLKIVNIDKLPYPLRTNFYVKAEKEIV